MSRSKPEGGGGEGRYETLMELRVIEGDKWRCAKVFITGKDVVIERGKRVIQAG